MGISGTGGVEPILTKNNYVIAEQRVSSGSAEQLFASSNPIASTDNFKKNLTTAAVKKMSAEIVRQENEKSKSIFSKGWDCLKTLLKIQTSTILPLAGAVFVADNIQLYKKMQNLHKQAVLDLKSQGVDIDDLENEDKIKYLAALANHGLGNITNNGFLQILTDMQKERAQKEVKSVLPPALKKFTTYLKNHFSCFFEKSGKIDNAAIKTAMKNAPKDIAEKLMLLYADSIEEHRAEILAAALKELPKGFDKKSIIEFAVSSEAMSEEKFKFAKALIENSDLSEEEKRKHLAKLEANKNKQRENTLKQAEQYWAQLSESTYYRYKNKIAKNDIIYEKICKEQKVVDKKIEEMKNRKQKFLDEKYNNHLKIEKIKRKAIAEMNNGQKVSAKLETQYSEEKSKKSVLGEDIYNINKQIAEEEIKWNGMQFKRTIVVNDSQYCLNAMQNSDAMIQKSTSLLDNISKFVRSIF